jgi:subtilisin family serine protease
VLEKWRANGADSIHPVFAFKSTKRISSMSKPNTAPHAACLRAALRVTILASALTTNGLLSAPAVAEKIDPALYDQDTEQLLVYLQPEVKPDDLAKRYGLKPVRTLASKINAHVLAADSVASARKLLSVLRQDKTVKAAFNNRRVARVAGQANDPLYPPSEASKWGQWHLNNDWSWPHIQAEGAWAFPATGRKVVIGVVDTGVDPDHKDLSLARDLSFDFVTLSDDPAPCLDPEACSKGFHGTAAAGTAAAIGFNKLGGRGVAYEARIADLRIPLAASYQGFISVLADRFVDAIHYRSDQITLKNHSWGFVYGDHDVTEDESAENYALQQTTAEGVIHIRGAGNERMDWNHKASANIPEQIVVAALGAHGHFAAYSNYGAGVFVTAPSGDAKWDDQVGITTTTLPKTLDGETGGYTHTFSGTSAATPQVSGALALAKEIRPDLDARLAKHLLVNSSTPIDLDDASQVGGWTVNQAGCAFNPNYGFGLLNTERLVQLAEKLTLSPLITWDIPAPEKSLPQIIPDDATAPLMLTVAAQTPRTGLFPGGRPKVTERLEEIGITVNIEHARPGDVEVMLISPSGTESRLRSGYEDALSSDTLPIRRTYWTNAFWGEKPTGAWTVAIRDQVSGAHGTLNDYTLHLRMGAVTAPQGFPVCENHALRGLMP